MTILIIVLIILLVLSIINNYYMYQYNYNESCPTKYIYNTKLPENVKFSTITFFYKDKTFKIIRFSLIEGVWLITLEKII